MAVDPPLVTAKCNDCPYIGKSRYPNVYRCGYCFYRRKVAGAEYRAKKLRARAKEFDAEAIEAAAKAEKFKKRHPEAGGTP